MIKFHKIIEICNEYLLFKWVLLERLCHSDIFWSPFIHFLHAHPQPLTGRQVLSKRTTGNPKRQIGMNDRKDATV